MIKNLFLYYSESFSPYKNLAAEKILFDNLKSDSAILYLWQNEDTVVIGKNQNALAECNIPLMKKDKIHLARRISGGGAVFHDKGNLNFTFISNADDFNIRNNLDIIVNACKKGGISAYVSGRNDILTNEKKFSGNAFYNAKGKSYHHGTILISSDLSKLQKYLTPSKLKLESKGIKSVPSRVINLSEISPDLTCDDMKKYMAEAFEEKYCLKPNLITEIDQSSLEIQSKIIADEGYLYGTPIPFSLQLTEKYDWGIIDINLNIKDGTIKSAKVFTDSLDWEIPEKLEKLLVNSSINFEQISKNIESSFSQTYSKDIISLLKKAFC